MNEKLSQQLSWHWGHQNYQEFPVPEFPYTENVFLFFFDEKNGRFCNHAYISCISEKKRRNEFFLVNSG